MGAKASKPAQSATRKFPTRTPGSSSNSAIPPRTSAAAAARPPPASASASSRAASEKQSQASFAKDDAIKADGMDPDSSSSLHENPAFARRLQQIGVVTPNPTLSNSSTAGSGNVNVPGPRPGSARPHRQQQQNTTLGALEARRRLEERARAELEDPGASGAREFLDVGTIRQALALRARGAPSREIERRLRLKEGAVERLGPEGVVLPLEGSSV
ncbi:hypothetical protein F4778DRAFT_749007 [Xylariomycetidae sp. FL2044]|nr:hypothetical protein F4778DRAFT_749007 [Xylariomycetidae sp. FL2044]